MHLKALADRAHLLRAWRRWHVEQLEEALADVHADVMSRLMAQLKDLHSARELVDFIAAQDWSVVDTDTRFTALHEINIAITKLRERNGQEPMCPGERVPDHQEPVQEFPAACGGASRRYRHR
jgi:hypothetical protein